MATQQPLSAAAPITGSNFDLPNKIGSTSFDLPRNPSPSTPLTPSTPALPPTNLGGTDFSGTALEVPLSSRGNQIVDAQGRPVQLAGINWYGMNYGNVPDGLWARDYKSMLSQMKSVGFNLLRIPFSYDAIYAGVDTIADQINYSIGSNAELVGKKPIEVLDAIVQEAGRQGLLVMLTHQTFASKTNSPELWYQEGYSESQWINMWTSLADRYRNQANVIGADIKNEPHGTATWGSNDFATDWRLAAERAGNQILSVNPNWLIVVEGVGDDSSNPNQINSRGYWWGENLERAGTAPVRLSNPNRLVYSPHTYGPGNAKALGVEEFIPYLNDPQFPNNLDSRWNSAFGYLHDQNKGALILSEFGGPGGQVYGRDGQWEQKLINYLDQRDISWAYWAWNPAPYGDMGGGILGADWNALNQNRVDALKPLLEEATPTPKFGTTAAIASKT
jgi:endoglucanase